MLFWVAFAAFLLTLPGGFGLASVAALLVMAITFALGLERTRLPDVHRTSHSNSATPSHPPANDP